MALRTALLENDQFEEGIKIAKAARLQALEAVTCFLPFPLAITFHSLSDGEKDNMDILSMRSNCMIFAICFC